MGVVCALRFDRSMGAMLASEESWTLRFQRRFHRVDLFSLVPEDAADAWGVEAVYAGAGHRALHDDVVKGTRDEVAGLYAKHKAAKKKPDPPTVREIGEIGARVLQRAMRRRIDQRLRFYYGLGLDDFNRGTFQVEGAKFPIGNAKVRDRAKQVIEGKEKDAVMKQVFSSRAAVLGYDGKKGIDLYHLDAATGALAYNHEGWEAIGFGHLAAAVPLGKLLNHRSAAKRAKGLPRARGMYELLLSGLTAAQHFYQADRDFAITIVEGTAARQAARVREFTDERARLATEVVHASELGFYGRPAAYGLLERLFFEEEDWARVESAMFDEARDPAALELALRGYKLEDLPELLPKRKGGRR